MGFPRFSGRFRHVGAEQSQRTQIDPMSRARRRSASLSRAWNCKRTGLLSIYDGAFAEHSKVRVVIHVSCHQLRCSTPGIVTVPLLVRLSRLEKSWNRKVKKPFFQKLAVR